MATRRKTSLQGADSRTPADAVLDANDTTLLDMLDKLLNKGVVLNGDIVLASISSICGCPACCAPSIACCRPSRRNAEARAGATTGARARSGSRDLAQARSETTEAANEATPAGEKTAREGGQGGCGATGRGALESRGGRRAALGRPARVDAG